jgi:hypothetical protein
MNTEQTLTRYLFDSPIRQKHKTQALCATDLVKAGNKFRIAQGLEPFDLSYYFGLQGTKEFVAEIEAKHGWAKYASRGRNASTWTHPILFLDIALALHPRLKVETYDWIMDQLCEFRDNSGDSYKKMCGVLWVRATNKQKFPEYIKEVAEKIRKACHVEDWNQADQRQLKLRDEIHNNIFWLADELQNSDKAIEIALSIAKKSFK